MANTDIPSFKNNHEEALKLYFENGYHIEPDTFTASECDDLIKIAHKLKDAEKNHYRPAMMPHRERKEFLMALSNKKITSIIEQLVSGPPCGLQTEFFFCKPGTKGFSLHQDNFFSVQADDNVFASAWTALTDITPEKGGLIIYPGAHKEGIFPVKSIVTEKDISQDPNANNEICVVPKKYTPLKIPFIAKGTTLFIHGLIPHASNANQSDEWRYVLLSTYIKTGEKFRAESMHNESL